jgi:alcohol dehydrogenase (NADP+)
MAVATLPTRGYAASSPTSGLAPFTFERRAPGAHDVVIEILYCGICHSDIHQVRNEWRDSQYPMVPGHEIIGRVTAVGGGVTRFAPGEVAGVGCFVDSCRTCANCKDGLEQYCETFIAYTYNSTEMDRTTPTFGGYSSQIVVDENYVLHIPPELAPASAAPLLCAGITTYSPLRHFGVGPGTRAGVVGLGGLGHVAVKLAAAMGAEVTVLSTSARKEADARRLGAHRFINTTDRQAVSAARNYFDLILDTVSAPHDLGMYLARLRRDGVMVLVGVPEEPARVGASTLITNRRRLAGSSIGGIAETQEMLDYCAAHGISADVELVSITDLASAYDRTVSGDVRYRFVIDMKTL